MLRWQTTKLAVLLTTLAAHAGLAHANSCEKLDAADLVAKVESEGRFFEPIKLLRDRGIDPEQLRGQTTVSPGRLEIALRHGEEPVGSIEVEHVYRENEDYAYVVASSHVNEPFRGKGLGALLYLAAGRLAFLNESRLLYMSVIVSKDARSLWQRFLDFGYAESIVGEYGEEVRIARKTIESPSAMNALDFVQSLKSIDP